MAIATPRAEHAMIVLLGASSFIGRSFAAELRRRSLPFIPLTPQALDYSRFDLLFDYVRRVNPIFLINAADYGVEGPESERQPERDMMMAVNAILPQVIARVCLMTKTPWGHVSSGNIFSGAHFDDKGAWRKENDLSRAEFSRFYAESATRFRGFCETDEPNFTFRSPTTNFYSGTKALAEEALCEFDQIYIWRARKSFNEANDPANFLQRLPVQSVIYNHAESISHVDDFAKAALDLWEIRAPYGTYNVTNPGHVLLGNLAWELKRAVLSEAFPPVAGASLDPHSYGRKLPQSHCIIDSSKLARAGVTMRTVDDAVRDALEKMRSAKATRPFVAPRQRAAMAA